MSETQHYSSGPISTATKLEKRAKIKGCLQQRRASLIYLII